MIDQSTLTEEQASYSASVIGLGPMGLPIALQLLGGGATVDAWNRSSGPGEAIRSAGGGLADSPTQLRGTVVFSALPDVDQLRSVLTAAGSPQWLHGRTLVVLSTTSPRKMRELQQELSEFGVEVADAPVSGGVYGAATGTLSTMVGATEEQFRRLLPVLRMFATTVEHVGPLGSGSLVKLCNQIVVASTLTAVAQAVVLAQQGGVEVEKLLRVLAGGLADSALLQAKSDRLLHNDYTGGGSARNQLKDLRYAIEVADDLGVTTTTIEPLRALFEQSVADGFGDLDHSVVRVVLERVVNEGSAPQSRTDCG